MGERQQKVRQPVKPGKYGQLLWQNGEPQVADLRLQNNGKRH